MKVKHVPPVTKTVKTVVEEEKFVLELTRDEMVCLGKVVGATGDDSFDAAWSHSQSIAGTERQKSFAHENRFFYRLYDAITEQLKTQ